MGANDNLETAVVPGYYLVCYNTKTTVTEKIKAVVPGYYLVCYNRERKNLYNSIIIQVFSCSKTIFTIPQKT